jgi:predicted TIM-barrel fold metal-dependent hydrolase
MSEYAIMQRALRGERLDDVFIIDAHGHLDYWKIASNLRVDAGAIVEAMDHLGVDLACINKWNCPDIQRANEDVAAALRDYPGRFAGFVATAPALGPEANRAELRRCFDELGFQGVKVHAGYETLPFRDTAAMRVSTAGLEAIWEFCHERRCPVLCHGFLTPEYARAYPEARFLAAHAGGCRHYTEVYEGCANVYFDTAASTTLAGTIEHFVAAGWEDRVVYGSDLPYAGQPYRFGQVVTARVPDPIMRQILGENMARVLGLR